MKMKRIKLILSTVMLIMAVGVSAQTYTWVEENKSFTDGTLLYTLGSYKQTYSRSVDLGSNEVAVSLYLRALKSNESNVTLVDTIWSGKPKVEGGTFTNTNNNGITSKYLGNEYNESVVVGDETTQQRYFYERTINCKTNGIKINTAETVTIPTTVNFNNKTYNVVAIPYAGFCFPDICTLFIRPQCKSGYGGNQTVEFWECMQGKNPILKTVNIATDSKLRDIGAYAFVGCINLGSIMIPSGVQTIGTGAFEFCRYMTDITFQRKADGLSADLTEIKSYAFYGDGELKSVRLPEGLNTIGSYTFIYNFNLTEIKLPNTLTTIGAHFLCDASSLVTLTVPANVTFINGAFLHGCQSLREVYMLGYARYLDEKTSNEDGTAFDENPSFCKEHVHDCTFYVPENYLEDYQKNPVWRLVNDEKQKGTTHSDTYIDAYGITQKGSHRTYGNQIIAIGKTRDFDPNKWVTAIFPKGVKNYRSDTNFGSGARFAKFIGAERIADAYDESVGKMVRMYNLKFEILKNSDNSFVNDIPAGTPGMFYTGKGHEKFVLWNKSDETDAFTRDMTKPHAVGFTASNDQAYIFMSGYYVTQTMYPYDFYFSNNQFWRVPEGETVDIDFCRCFWTVMVDGLPAQASAKMSRFFDEATGIGTITVAVEEPTEIYDLSGRKLNSSDKLKSGIYIINGKKVMVK